MNEMEIAELEGIIAQTEAVLSTSERNGYGDWIGNEHLLLEWTQRIKKLADSGLRTYRQQKDIKDLLNTGLAHPCEAIEMKRLLGSVMEEISTYRVHGNA